MLNRQLERGFLAGLGKLGRPSTAPFAKGKRLAQDDTWMRLLPRANGSLRMTPWTSRSSCVRQLSARFNREAAAAPGNVLREETGEPGSQNERVRDGNEPGRRSGFGRECFPRP